VSDVRVAPKEYYSISEVCDLAGLKPHVLRYWEGQFPALAPSKNRSGNRVYLRREIELILLIKQLLHEEKYTIEGARRRLNQLRRGGELPAATAAAVDRELLLELRSDLHNVLAILSLD
jgi:DNA-binding transcriptional MerR regulator